MISFQPLCSSPTRFDDRHAHVVVEGGARGRAGHRRAPASRRSRASSVGTMMMLRPLCRWRLLVGAARQPHVVGVLDEAGPHLLAVDDVLVAVADRSGAQRREVGARLGLGVADGEVDLAARDLRQVVRLLLLGAVRHDRRPDGVERQERHGRAGDGRPRRGRSAGRSSAGLRPPYSSRPADGEPAVERPSGGRCPCRPRRRRSRRHRRARSRRSGVMSAAKYARSSSAQPAPVRA